MHNDLYKNELINIILEADLFLESIDDIKNDKYYKSLYDIFITGICLIILSVMMYFIFNKKTNTEPNTEPNTELIINKEPIIIDTNNIKPTKKPDHNDNIKSFNEYDSNNLFL